MNKRLIVWVVLFMPFMLVAQGKKITPETALKSYIENGDKSYKWEQKDSFKQGKTTGYNILLTSQTWRGHVWKHQLTVFVPDEVAYDGALLFITGGSINAQGEPNWADNDDRYYPALSQIATKNKAVTALIKQVPNQPLFGKLTEDALISYTFHNFKNDKDYSWPMLFPMVKSAVRSMDAIQEFVKKNTKHTVNRFVVSGASKRGWTTWLTSAIDDSRVAAIGPMVIDMLNMPATLGYQYKTYGEYSEQIEDYTKLGIAQDIDSEDGKALQAMIDPYSYRAKLTLPKMIFLGTNDEYWTLDAIKFSWNEMPGKNMIHFVPNAGHNLGGGQQAFEALSGFFATTLQNKEYPVLKWDTRTSVIGSEISISAPKEGLEGANLWYTSSSDKDFRNNFWQSRRVKLTDGEVLKVQVPNPTKGYYGFYIDLKYKDASGGSYTVSTKAFIADTKGLVD